MINVELKYNFVDNMNQEAFTQFVVEMLAIMKESPGFIKTESFQNLFSDNPRYQSNNYFEKLSDWAQYTETKKYKKMKNQMKKYYKDIQVTIWEPLEL